MTIECYVSNCKNHCNHSGEDGPFCYMENCQYEPLTKGVFIGCFSAETFSNSNVNEVGERKTKLFVPEFFDDTVIEEITKQLGTSIGRYELLKYSADFSKAVKGDYVVWSDDIPPEGWTGDITDEEKHANVNLGHMHSLLRRSASNCVGILTDLNPRFIPQGDGDPPEYIYTCDKS